MPQHSSMPAGYSGTPLARKLGIRAGMQIVTRRAPDEYVDWLQPLPADVAFTTDISAGVTFAHVFARQREDLHGDLLALRPLLASTGVLWVSWPKQSSKVPTTINEDTIRELALPLGLVDIKVCAVSAVWSGLKLVIRRELR